jgi:uncharacterized protein YdeI (BOF family)
MMTHVFTTAALALTIAAGAAAQSTKVKSETKIEVKDGKDVTLTGCVARSVSGTAYLLNDAEGREVDAPRSYILVGEVDLDEHIGHLVEVKGKASNLGDDAKVEVKTKTEIERDDADDKEMETKTTLEGDLAGVPYLGVDSVKMVRSTCS